MAVTSVDWKQIGDKSVIATCSDDRVGGCQVAGDNHGPAILVHHRDTATRLQRGERLQTVCTPCSSSGWMQFCINVTPGNSFTPLVEFLFPTNRMGVEV